jgi:hypothetical protein
MICDSESLNTSMITSSPDTMAKTKLSILSDENMYGPISEPLSKTSVSLAQIAHGQRPHVTDLMDS